MSVDIKSNQNKREFCVSTPPQEKSKEGSAVGCGVSHCIALQSEAWKLGQDASWH